MAARHTHLILGDRRMPHVFVEYSANVADHAPIDELVAAMHTAIIETDIGPLAGIRTRGFRRDDYAIADRHADNMFVAVIIRIGPGRTPEVKKACVADMTEALKIHLAHLCDTKPIALSVEMQEIDAEFRINHNNLRDYLEARHG